jgi:hypothetical protein
MPMQAPGFPHHCNVGDNTDAGNAERFVDFALASQPAVKPSQDDGQQRSAD